MLAANDSGLGGITLDDTGCMRTGGVSICVGPAVIRSIGAKLMTTFGWEGGAMWRGAVDAVSRGGTIENISGKIPTINEAEMLINKAGGRIQRYDLQGHSAPNPHQYPHINYETSSGSKGTIQVKVN